MNEAPERIWLLWADGLIENRYQASATDHTEEGGYREFIRLDAHEAAVAAARKEGIALRDSGDDVIRASNTLMLMLVGELAMTKPALEAAIRRALDARNAWDNVVKANEWISKMQKPELPQ